MFKATLQALALTAVLAAAPAQAQLTPNGAVDCSASLVTDNLANNPTFTDCAGAFTGNNKNQEGDVLATITDEFGLTIQSIFDVSGSAGTSGAFDLNAINGAFVLAVKAGNGFSLYAFSDGELIEWDTLGVGFFNGAGRAVIGNGLSHATVYTTTTTPVPEPETYALMMAGLAFVGWASRRRQRQR
jgi:hypothetical protein